MAHGNKYCVGLSSNGLIILRAPVMRDRNDALNLVAFICAMARLTAADVSDATAAAQNGLSMPILSDPQF